MNSSGMVRKIDELGRIVIPKEIRKNINIRDGEELEIIVKDNNIILKKINTFINNKELLNNIIKKYYDLYKINMIITPYDNKLDPFILNLIKEHDRYLSSKRETFFGINAYFYMEPLIIDSTCYGLIVIYDDISINNNLINSIKLIVSTFSYIYDIN